ncbi:MAG: carboxypeptidase regulatory-like domain-containing protein [Bacteroidetes bacterium]|nr:carboxypeptidase regulatory-like domain-containing protein [Bacteroidota bacterium]
MESQSTTRKYKLIPRSKPSLAGTLLLTVAAATVALLLPYKAFAGDIKGIVRLADHTGSTGTVVYIQRVDSTFKPPSRPVMMDQKDMKFIPSVLAVLAGTKVTFLNSDNVLHNVFSPSQCAGSFDLGTWPKGESRSHVFSQPDCFSIILCNVHPQMQAWIAVLQNPYFTIAKDDGSFEIRNVPPGHYVLSAWHGFYQRASAAITVTESGTVVQNFRLVR